MDPRLKNIFIFSFITGFIYGLLMHQVQRRRAKLLFSTRGKTILPAHMVCMCRVVNEKAKPLMSCEAQVKSGAIEGMVLGAIIGGVAGVLDTALALLDDDGRGIRFFDRLIGNILQGGSLGLLLGTIFSVIKYCY